MRATDFLCLFLGRPADHLHHVTGRDADGQYLDADLVGPVSRRQHVVEHQGWRMGGFGEGSRSTDNVLRLLRAGHLLVRIAEHYEIGAVVLPTAMVRELGRALQRIARELEADA